METPGLIENLRRDGALLAGAVSTVEPDRPVPTCPDWVVRDLVHHMGMVHRWAAEVVRSAADGSPDAEGVVAAQGGYPPDDRLVAWFLDGHAAVVDALESAPVDLSCWTFLPAPSPRAFWARRQAHETAIHRADAEAAGSPITPFPAAFAADGIDELLMGFAARPGGRLKADRPRSLAVAPVDGDSAGWVVTVGPARATVARGDTAGADCTVTGPASDLYLWVWNRRDLPGLDVSGDPSVLDLWRDGVRIRWR
jgi:uncharacterized protein (TIGR03083 family)